MKIEEKHWNFPNQTKNALVLKIHERNAYIFKDGLGNCHFAIETTYSSYSTINTEGLQVVFNELDLDDKMNIQVIQFKCSHPSFLGLFVRIINEIIDNSESSNFETKTRSTINIWMRFLNRSRKPRMDDTLILGLYGELLFIEKLVMTGIEESLILDCWTGPDHESKDFSFENAFVEVKASSRTAGHTHVINGIDQLNAFDRKLYFASFHLSKLEGKQNCSVNTLIDNLNQKYFEPYGLELKFYDKLYDYGYDKRDVDYYDGVLFNLTSEKLLIVDSDFPKITNDIFKSPLDSRVSKIKYEIDVNSLYTLQFNILKDVIR